jgi:probable HAF family extracellular repeat protein
LQGHVVGYSHISPTLGTFHAFLYTSESGMVDLNTLIDPQSGWSLSRAADINDAGIITGNGIVAGENHAFLLIPVPEPPLEAVAIIGCAICSLASAAAKPTAPDAPGIEPSGGGDV